MDTLSLYRSWLWRFIAASLVAAGTVAETTREHLPLDANWKFRLGDDWPNFLNLAKAGASTGPASEKFSDRGWRTIDLLHDWAIELPFDKSAGTGHGYIVRRPEGGYYPFREDITDLVKFGGRNLLTVRVDASKLEGWFDEGAGIYLNAVEPRDCGQESKHTYPAGTGLFA